MQIFVTHNYTVSIWCIDMNENIIARKFLTQKILRTKLMRITVHYIIFVIHKMMLLHFLWLQEFEIERALRISRLPEEPDASSPTAVQVLLRLPSGQRLERRFTETDKLEVWNSTTYIKMLLSFFHSSFLPRTVCV